MSYEWCKVFQAAFWYGLIVHFRVYPIIYALPFFLVIPKPNAGPCGMPALQQWDPKPKKSLKSLGESKTSIWLLLKNCITKERILFGLFSGSVFLLWTYVCFYLYGWDFLNEALLYHLTRTDPRHNFSIYFYHIYLHHQKGFSVLEKLISFLPQMMVQLALIFRFFEDLPFCLFAQTVTFVAFNKVITAQYFVWFFCLLPLILPWSNMKLKWRGLICITVWMASQVHWLMWAYLLEFKGQNVFLQLWVASLMFLAANTWVLIMAIKHHQYSAIFRTSSTSHSDDKKLK